MDLSLLLTVTAFAAEEAAEASGGGLPQMDVSTFASQLFWLALTFGLLFWRMRVDLLPRLGGIIEERKDRIADDLDQAAEFRQQSEDAQKAYEDALGAARAKAQNIAGETRKAIDDEISALQSSMEQELAEKVGDAEKRILAMQETAAGKVREAAGDTTRAIVEALIEEVPTQDAVQAAIAAANAS